MHDAFAERLAYASGPTGAAMFSRAREDGGEDLYFTPVASQIAKALLKANGAVACLPPVDDGTMELLGGQDDDRRLLSS